MSDDLMVRARNLVLADDVEHLQAEVERERQERRAVEVRLAQATADLADLRSRNLELLARPALAPAPAPHFESIISNWERAEEEARDEADPDWRRRDSNLTIALGVLSMFLLFALFAGVLMAILGGSR